MKIIGTFSETGKYAANLDKEAIILNMPWLKLSKAFKYEMVKLIVV